MTDSFFIQYRFPGDSTCSSFPFFAIFRAAQVLTPRTAPTCAGVINRRYCIKSIGSGSLVGMNRLSTLSVPSSDTAWSLHISLMIRCHSFDGIRSTIFSAMYSTSPLNCHSSFLNRSIFSVFLTSPHIPSYSLIFCPIPQIRRSRIAVVQSFRAVRIKAPPDFQRDPHLLWFSFFNLCEFVCFVCG